jgi:DNA modification methylase
MGGARMQIELRAVDSVRPYPGNPRKNDQAVEAVARAITEFGWRQPIVVDSGGVIVVGHTRWRAAKHLGLAEVPVHVANDLSPEKAKAYRVADNQLASIAEWDMPLLQVELTDLKDLGLDLGMLGFDGDALAGIMGTGDPGALAGGADDCPAVAPVAVTRPGDLWVLGGEGGEGGHRLLCGDSTLAGDVDRVLGGERAALCSTDPPYLVDYTGERPDHDGGNKGGKDWSATYKEVQITDAGSFFRAVFTNIVGAIKPHAAIYCWHAHKRQRLIAEVWEELGILDHQQVVWVKPCPVFGRVFWHFQHEPCMMGWVQGSMPSHDDDHSFSSVWSIDWEGKARIVGNEHPTQKPVEIFARPMRKHTRRGDIVFEPFSGSGSQLIAAESLGRRCCAIELEPVFVDVGLRRWMQATGKMAVLEATGQSYDQVRAERGVGEGGTGEEAGAASEPNTLAEEKAPAVAEAKKKGRAGR